MYLVQMIKRTLFSNRCLIIGVLVGFIYGYFGPIDDCYLGFEENPLESPTPTPISIKPVKDASFMPSTSRKPTESKEKLIRPRYYSTELGIREKLFVGVFTSDEKINTQATYINQSIAHVVDKVKFFITARTKMKTQFNLSGIVGFTDTRNKYRPFQVLKYVADAFLQTYDFYLLINDFNYLNVRRLKDVVNKISVSKDVYLGTRTEDGSFCNLDAGILLSNSVLKAIKDNLESCMLNVVLDDASENIGRCIHHSLGLECQEIVQDQTLSSYKLKHFQMEKYLIQLTAMEKFNEAVIVYPILEARDYFILNAYFARERLVALKKQITNVGASLTDSWPPGQRTGAKPATRFDLPPLHYFNTTHTFFPDDFTNVKPHSAADQLDISNVLEELKARALYEHAHLQYRRLINGYKRFDLSRGLDYTLDLSFRDLRTGKEVVRRFEVCKPLSKVEFVAAPYVTENSRVTILLAVEEKTVALAMRFLAHYNAAIMERRDKASLMLVLLYGCESASKGDADVFATVKNSALMLSGRSHGEEKIAWVSIRLPKSERVLSVNKMPLLQFAIVDLALKKIGVDALTLIVDVHCNVSVEFMNRVRMNTIANFQIFNAIPFRHYDPKVSLTDTMDVNKNGGHFDREEYKYVAFYGKDYVAARKRSQNVVPIIRIDNDISRLVPMETQLTIFEMFVKYTDHIHCMRATEKELRVQFHEEDDETTRENLFYGTKVQLAKALLQRKHDMDVEF